MEESMKGHNISKGLYENPALAGFQNLSYLYSIPYENLTLGYDDRNFKLTTLISLRNKKALVSSLT